MQEKLNSPLDNVAKSVPIYHPLNIYNLLTAITVSDIFYYSNRNKGEQRDEGQCERWCADRSDILYLTFPVYTETRVCHYAIH